MEDTLRALNRFLQSNKEYVLILVLMEDTLRAEIISVVSMKETVLILVLMEDTLREMKKKQGKATVTMGLNPCFNGRYSQSAKTCVPLFIVV